MVKGIGSSKNFANFNSLKIGLFYPKNTNKPLPQGSKMFIDFTSLPIDLKTEENRKNYDKDMNGFLDPYESYNMQQAYPDLDLSVYRNDNIDHVTNSYNEEKGGLLAEAYDKDGNVIITTESQAYFWDEDTVYRRTEYKKEGNATVSTSDVYDLGGARIGDENFERVTENATYKGKSGYTKTEGYDGVGHVAIYVKGNHHVWENYDEMGVLRSVHEDKELPKEGVFEKHYTSYTYYAEDGKYDGKRIKRTIVLHPNNRYGISVLGFADEDENGKEFFSSSVPCEEIREYDKNNNLVYHEIYGRNIAGDMDFKRIVLVDQSNQPDKDN